MEIMAVNDLTDSKTLAHLLKYDTAYRIYEKDVSFGEGFISVNKKKIPVLAEKDPVKLPWKKLKIDVVLECTGLFVKDGTAKLHLQAGAKKVIVSAPTTGEGDIQTYLLGVNHAKYADEEVISNASCTTNSLGPVAEIVHRNFGIKKAMMTTVHSYTQDQNLQDGPHRDLRRARAAAANMVPTTTGAAISVTEALPQLKGKFDGLAIRVPTVVGSISDFTILVGRKVTATEINDVFRTEALSKRYSGILAVTDEPLVSSDIIGNPHSSIVDLLSTKVVDGDLVKILAWYDNEWGYAHQLVEQIYTVTK